MNEVQKALKNRYAHLHPVLFQRSLEKAKTDTELFDILDKITEYPVVWDEDCRAWIKTDLLHVPIRRE
jgi:hypothetical protein